ncbi:MAG: hypothetical protein F2681_01220 [Actinobacteria bacterium]|uniref:Unannotated protein n=1 Tax=freshwater metagenome TaxID=449393 RepID=A0A6J6PXH5_9ZZZZ|nr:hypothetical protein [Actinomycetota bacterium]MSW77647.1 hypothetical protein [Actinomycetota bacterium]MSX54209.1 hypothetical protein [Actinomycetota bacterium]MSX92242.1 hypothetical protein [Actinomycetota bacterium]MSZ81745.1 hypothetical protein [Actinomycetota bacterium]
MSASRWSVAADDRTGAFEVAALIAQALGEGPVLVTVGAPAAESGVVDLATRGLGAADARTIAAGIESRDGWAGHKMDSTLRGNWAVEARARRQVGGRRVVVLPGWPDLGRTCVRGVVRLFDEQVGDMRQHMPEATFVPHAAGLAAWVRTGGGLAVCDVPDTETMYAMAATLADVDPAELLVVGPAGPLAAAFAAHVGRPLMPSASRPEVGERVLVVCGSANSTSRRQIERLRMSRPDVEVLAVPVLTDDADLNPWPARELAERARVRIGELQPSALVIIGGDTAAAVLGDAPRRVGGMIGPGMPWGLDEHGVGPLVITKAGGFGGLNALIDLFGAQTV